MGLSFRKSLRVGPLKFNLSGSGIGISTGVPGFRIGTGPRGTYVHLGQNGVYYRATLPMPGRGRRSPEALSGFVETHELAGRPPHDAADVANMQDTNASELLDELNEKASRINVWPVVAICVLLEMLVAIQLRIGVIGWWIAAVTGVIVTLIARYLDRMRKTTVICFAPDDQLEAAFAGVREAIDDLGRCRRVWRLEARGRVANVKYHAGAQEIVDRRRVSITESAPPHVVTNVPIPTIPLGRSALYFFPDRVLSFDGVRFGALPYDELRVSSQGIRFVESEGVPRDATIVGHTWRFVNKDGGPDLRFNNNHQLPICQYEQTAIENGRGVMTILQLSKQGASASLAQSFERLAAVLACNANLNSHFAAIERKPPPRLSEPQTAMAERFSDEQVLLIVLAMYCCIIVGNGKVAARELMFVFAEMRKMQPPWTDAELKRLTRSFIDSVREHGFPQILQRTLRSTSQLRATRHARGLLVALATMRETPGLLGTRERQVCVQFESVFRQE